MRPGGEGDCVTTCLGDYTIQYTPWAVGVKVFSNESKDRKRDELLMINLWFSSRHCPSPSTMSTLDVFVRLQTEEMCKDKRI